MHAHVASIYTVDVASEGNVQRYRDEAESHVLAPMLDNEEVQPPAVQLVICVEVSVLEEDVTIA